MHMLPPISVKMLPGCDVVACRKHTGIQAVFGQWMFTQQAKQQGECLGMCSDLGVVRLSVQCNGISSATRSQLLELFFVHLPSARNLVILSQEYVQLAGASSSPPGPIPSAEASEPYMTVNPVKT